MTTLQLINYIVRYNLRNPSFTNVVILGNDEMTILAAIEDLSLNAHDMTWSVNVTECKNTILVY